jgi:hypothetical protein
MGRAGRPAPTGVGGYCQILSEIFFHEHHQTHIGRLMIPTCRGEVTEVGAWCISQ